MRHSEEHRAKIAETMKRNWSLRREARRNDPARMRRIALVRACVMRRRAAREALELDDETDDGLEFMATDG